MNLDYTVPPPIEAIDQGNADLCWLAATAVLFSWKDARPVSMADTADRLGVEFIALYGAGKAVPFAEVQLWAQRGGLSMDGLECIDASGWNTMLRAQGPLITMVDGSGEGSINHAVVVYGISGDGTPGGTTMQVANGQNADLQQWTLSQFVTIFEATPDTNLSFSVLYFPKAEAMNETKDQQSS